MEQKQIPKNSEPMPADAQLDIPVFISQFNNENFEDLMVKFLHSPSGQGDHCVREYLTIAKPIVENEYFSVTAYQLEHVKTVTKKSVKKEVISTFLITFCLQTKQGDLFRSREEQMSKLFKLSKDCVNLQPTAMSSGPCTDDNILLFSAIKSTDDEREDNDENPTYFMIIAFKSIGAIH